MVPQVARQPHLHLLVEVRALVVMGHGREGLARQLGTVGLAEYDGQSRLLPLPRHQLDLDRNVPRSIAPTSIRKVQLLGRDIEQVAELVVRAFDGRQAGGADAIGPRGRRKVQDLFARPGFEVRIGLQTSQLGGEAVLDGVAGHADVQLQRAFDALQLFELGGRTLEVLQVFVEVLVLQLVRLLLEEGADGEGDGGEVVQAGRQVGLAGRPAGSLVLTVQAASPTDGKPINQ